MSMAKELFSGCTTAPETINTYSSQGGLGAESTSPIHKGNIDEPSLVPVTSCGFTGAIACCDQKVVIHRAPSHYLTLSVASSSVFHYPWGRGMT